MAQNSTTTKVQITSKVPPKLKTRLEKYAEEKSVSTSAAIYRLIEEALDHEQLRESLVMEMKINREETRQLASLLVANLHRSKAVAEKDIPKMIRGSVLHAHDIVLESED